jgi:hypothetical protein
MFMVRHWIIRSLALALLTLCVVAWVHSCYFFVRLTRTAGGQFWCLGWACGTVGIAVTHGPGYRSGGWEWNNERVNPAIREGIENDYSDSSIVFAGFAGTWKTGAINEERLLVPLWFPTLLSALLLWLVWRKTRPAYNGRGFPVEVAGKEAAKS